MLGGIRDTKIWSKNNSMLEILFSILMLLVPLAALMNFNFLRIFPLLFIGANPYVASASLLASFFFRFGLVVKFDTRKSIYIVFFIWLFYSILLMIKGFSNLLVRDKRYNKGVKKRFNYVSLIIFGIAIGTFYLAFRFYNLT